MDHIPKHQNKTARVQLSAPELTMYFICYGLSHGDNAFHFRRTENDFVSLRAILRERGRETEREREGERERESPGEEKKTTSLFLFRVSFAI